MWAPSLSAPTLAGFHSTLLALFTFLQAFPLLSSLYLLLHFVLLFLSFFVNLHFLLPPSPLLSKLYFCFHMIFVEAVRSRVRFPMSLSRRLTSLWVSTACYRDSFSLQRGEMDWVCSTIEEKGGCINDFGGKARMEESNRKTYT
jgi:hypothetical protein